MKHFQYVCADPGIPVPGTKGASIHVASVCRAFVKAGLQGTIHALRPKAAEFEGSPILPLDQLPKREQDTSKENEMRLFLSAGAIQNSLQRHLENSQCPRPDFVYERYTLWNTGGLAHARQLDVPFILEVNSPLPDEASRYRNLHHQGLAEGIAATVLEEADGIVCVSREVAAWVKRRRGHDDGVWVIPNGVDRERFAPQPSSRPLPLPHRDVPLVAFAGSFRPWHGLGHLLNAFEILTRAYPEAFLVCVGDGPERASFEQRVIDRGLEHQVHVTGHVPHSEVAKWLGGADVTVAPYPALDDFYFSPLKIFEFMALGLPVVASATGQIRDLLPNGERGFLYRAGDSQDLAATLGRVLSEPAKARACADTARDWVLEHATWEKRVDAILANIEGLQ